jgi:hypothetical protein
MGNNDSANNRNILVKVDQNNLMYIDPNSVVDKEGNVLPRNVEHENLVMYANLEADLIPRSILVAENDKNTLTSIAKGTLNFLKNQDGSDYDSTWTDAYLNTEKTRNNEDIFYQSDKTSQSFGIDSIQVSIKGINSIPQVNINFIDVRGKTLFESPENSPYKAFFHVPWPIFYLTLKGYYGKAIRYRLHLVKFSSRYNDSNGNFEVTTSFVGSTYAYLTDISLKAILNCPYMYPIISSTNNKEDTKNNQVSRKVANSSRGYEILKSVYSEYKRKGLIPKDFPNKTLRELIVLAQNLDKTLEDQILGQVLDANIFVGLRDYDEKITRFERQVTAWAGRNLLRTFDSGDDKSTVIVDDIRYYNISATDKTKDDKIITGKTIQGTLEFIIETNRTELKSSSLFNNAIIDASKSKSTKISEQDFSSFKTKETAKVENYFRIRPDNGFYQVAIDKLVNDILDIKKLFVEQRKKLENVIENKMNEIIRDKNKGGFGFDPTIRNIFAIILANAEVYIRLMKEVHQKSFDSAQERKKLIKNFSNETQEGEPIYPWPEVKKNSDGEKIKVIAYPGESDLVKKLKSDNPLIWPEVEFVENFIEVSTNKVDTNSEKENGANNITFNFDDDTSISNFIKINTIFDLTAATPYIDQSPSSFLYEIWERAIQTTLIDSFRLDTIQELAENEFENIKNSIKNNDEIITLLKEKIDSHLSLQKSMEEHSKFERYPYYKDYLPTIDYIKDILNFPFEISEYKKSVFSSKIGKNEKLNKNLKEYTPQSYRKNIYPFNSDEYLFYINKNSFTDEEFKFNGNLIAGSTDGFITSPINAKSWVKLGGGYTQNIFQQKLKINNTSVNILNTPYFHKQLYNDFNKVASYGKYAGSSYLLLNSLPFCDLEDMIDFNEDNTSIRMSSLFREVSSTHFLPYHLIVKWGSIYHRYKKFILEGVDIISDVTTPINESLFFDNNNQDIFNINGDFVSYNINIDLGIHPFYDAIYHQVINDYNHYIVESGNTSYEANIAINAILGIMGVSSNGFRYWTNLVDNSKYFNNDLRFTILPSRSNNKHIYTTNTTSESLSNNTYQTEYQNYFRIIFEDDYLNDTFSGTTFPSPNQYHKTLIDNEYSLSIDYKKVIDLIATFSPKILEDFEDIFLEFASEKIKDESSYFRFGNTSYTKFQDLLKDISSVEKKDGDSIENTTDFLQKIKTRQNTKLQGITSAILSDRNLVKFTIGNPKEIDSHVFHGFAEVDNLNTFRYESFRTDDLTNENKNLIKLYIGEDIDLHYQNFFLVNDVRVNEENILLFRPLALIYGGFIKSGGINTKTAFQQYIKNNIFINFFDKSGITSAMTRAGIFITTLTKKFKSLEGLMNRETNRIVSGYNNDPLKIELYNYFKSFNDKWIGGNSIGQRLLLEEFLFLDKANVDIGDKFYLNISKILDLGSTKNDKIDLYSVLNIMIAGSGLDMKPLPTYINFYGTNVNNKSKITPSKKVAENIFGTFLEVDYQESSPKIIVQLVGPTSKHPNMDGKKYKFTDDSFNISNTNNNPMIITTPNVFRVGDLSKSNKVVAFEVSFGDQNQSIFKGVQLDQTTLKNTTESFVVLENLARSESGAGAYNVDVGLFDYYRQASYSCDVTSMGNAMIQPTMFFYLKNIPIFKGSYWITEVTHNIKTNGFTTTFKGTRIPYASLPDPKDSFTSSYRVLFDKLVNKVLTKYDKQQSELTKTSVIITYNGATYVTEPGELIQGEDIQKNIVRKVNITNYGIPYNGFLDEKNIQLVKYTHQNEEGEWLRARVVEMGGKNYFIGDEVGMGVVSRTQNNTPLLWSEAKLTTGTTDFYTTKFNLTSTEFTADKIVDPSVRTIFVNPNPKQKTTETLQYSISGTGNARIIQGPIGNGPSVDGYGVGMSSSLMKKLKLNDGDVVYFRMTPVT